MGVDRGLDALGEAGAEVVQVHVGVGGHHLGEGGEAGGRDEGVAVERPLLRGAVGDHVHQVGPAAERGAGRAAADRLGEAREVGLHAVALGGAAGCDRRAALHLVEDQDDAAAGADLAQRLEVAGLGLDETDVHHHRLEDQAGGGVGVLGEERVECGRVVERDDPRVVRDVGGDPLRHRQRRCVLEPADGVGVRDHREHHGVVVAVVRAFDLHDVVAAGRGAGDPDRVHRRLGPRVGEPHLLEPEAAAELLRERDRDLGGRGEVGAGARGAVDRLDDLRVGVADDHAPEAVVVVDPLPPVDVPDLAPRARGRRRAGTGRRPGSSTPRRGAATAWRARTAPPTPGSRRSASWSPRPRSPGAVRQVVAHQGSADLSA